MVDRNKALNIVDMLQARYKLTVEQACDIACVSLRTYYNWLAKRNRGEDPNEDLRTLNTKANRPDRHTLPWELSLDERQKVLDLICSPEYVGLSIRQAYFKALADGVPLCSQSTFNRIAADAGMNRDRRRRRARKSTKKPNGYVAHAPNEVWCWDITYLKEVNGRFYYAYVIIDLYSRYIVHYRVFNEQTAEHAVEFLREAFEKHHVKHTKLVLHADNGTPMKAEITSNMLAACGVIESHSRPHVSDDNPFIESVFNTLKNAHGLANRQFKSTDEAELFLGKVVEQYHDRHHSGINDATPRSRFNNEDQAMLDKMNKSREEYWRMHPERALNHKRKAAPYTVAGSQQLNMPPLN